MIRRVLSPLLGHNGKHEGARTILLTGACGTVATLIRPFLAQAGIHVRLTDVRPVTDLAETETFAKADLRDAGAVSNVLKGCSGVVHLGGIAKDREFWELVEVDIAGVTNVLESARRHGVQRVVLASSMHVLGFHSRQEPLTESSPPKPDSRYAVSKLFGELAGSLFASKYGLAVTCLRLGHVTARREDAEPGSWVSPEDVAALVRLGLDHPDIRYEVINAVAPYDGDDAAQRALVKRLGFRFAHRGTTHAEAVEEAGRYFAWDPAAAEWRGGVFASRDGEPE